VIHQRYWPVETPADNHGDMDDGDNGDDRERKEKVLQRTALQLQAYAIVKTVPVNIQVHISRQPFDTVTPEYWHKILSIPVLL